MAALDADPRWRRFNDPCWTCPACGMRHGGIFDLGYDHPDPWTAVGGPPQPNSALLEGGDVLCEDFCVLGDACFVRAVLPLPVSGSGQDFCYGVWAGVWPNAFEELLSCFDPGTQGRLGPYPCRVENRLPGSPIRSARARLQPRDGRQRPQIRLEEPAHPLTTAQDTGISFDSLLDIYARAGHDIRPHLTEPRP